MDLTVSSDGTGMTEPQELQQELEDLKEANWLLELSDDRLFINANGNLSKYRRNEQRIREIEEELKEWAIRHGYV